MSKVSFDLLIWWMAPLIVRLSLQTNYRAENTDDEPDPHIQDLTNDLSQCESVVQSTIPPRDRE